MNRITRCVILLIFFASCATTVDHIVYLKPELPDLKHPIAPKFVQANLPECQTSCTITSSQKAAVIANMQELARCYNYYQQEIDLYLKWKGEQDAK